MLRFLSLQGSIKLKMTKEPKIAIIGLGYVGLPLAIEFSKKYPTVGYDISERRLSELRGGKDSTREADEAELREVLSSEGNGLSISDDLSDIRDCNVFIITVPTPIDVSNRPDLKPLESASKSIGSILKKGDTVIYESTTYPGCTEEVCVPILEQESGLRYNEDFFVGYSPERINPGDKVNTLTKIKKVTSGSTPETADFVDELYGSIITAGTYKAASLKVAEASKAIENAQRDVNISFVNELALIFDKIGIDTTEVLEAAGTKWNFLKYRPGLVGGHCIGVDPYYLAYKAEQAGYIPNVILSGRRVNDSMGEYIANKVVKMMIGKGMQIKDAECLLLGITFKENCPDFRNTKVVDIYSELQEFGCRVSVYDPWADPQAVEHELGISLISREELTGKKFDSIILAVAHDEFLKFELPNYIKNPGVVYDCKSVLERNTVDARL